MEILSKNTGETKDFAGKIAQKIKPGDILFLYGNLGSGKTTFTRYLVESLGISARVQSPTFVLLRKYSGGMGPVKNVNHLDLYRLTLAEDVRELGFSELINEPDSVTVVEWPDAAEDEVQTTPIIIKFEYVDENSRKINVQNLD